MEGSRKTEECAGAWLARRESGNWSEGDQLHFTQWLNASTANRVAFLRQEAAWEHALRLQALKGSTPAGTVPSPEDWRLSPFFSNGQSAGTSSTPASGFSRRRVFYSLAASIVLAVTAGFAWHFWSQGPTYSTPVGGIAAVPMTDGSRIILNTDTQIRLAVNERERRIDLEQGEAFFDVAKDPSRPFVVRAGNKRVIAVGTAFSVRREKEGIRVVVTEGKVRIEDDELASPRRSGLATQRASSDARAVPDGMPRSAGQREPAQQDDNQVPAEILVTAGSIARAGEAGLIVQHRAVAEIEDYLSWRAGFLIFRETPLADAIAEFNRYNEQQIFIEDPGIASLRFSGKIRPTSFEPFLRLLEETYPIEARRGAGRIVITAAN